MKISYEQLKECSNELSVSVQNINEILENVGNVARQITSSKCWTGPAADYYVTNLSKFSESFIDVNQSLEKSVLYLNNVLEGYENIDKNITNITSNISN